jgi:hypothetical protein
MDFKLVNSMANDVDQGLQQLYAEKGELVGKREEVSDRIETLEAIIEAEEAKKQSLARHMPDAIQVAPSTPSMGPTYRG